ncbi:MAG: hypothetical protein ACPGD7_05375, partial [bacterium]
SLYGWFLYSENFHSSQYTSHPVILREAEGEDAESIIQQITLALKESSDRCRSWLRDGEEHFLTHLIHPRENVLQRKKVFFRS